jgi:hypothetical protein
MIIKNNNYSSTIYKYNNIELKAICNNLKKMGIQIRTKKENAKLTRLDLANKKFTRLLCIKPTKLNDDTAWQCKCDCGKIVIIKTEYLTNEDTKSCGCLNIEKAKENLANSWTRKNKFSPEIATARKIWQNRYNDGISFEDFYHMSQLNCAYCNEPPSNIGNASTKNSSEYFEEYGNFVYNGLDRIDSSLLHTLDNCVPCCKYCNFSKRERSVQEYYDWLEKTYLFLKEKINKLK